MKKIIVLVLFFTTLSFSADAELDIVKKSIDLPKIEVSLSLNATNKPLVGKIKKMVEKDFQVSGHFDVLKTDMKVDYNSSPDMLILSNRGTDLFLNIDSNIGDFSEYSVMVKLYDVNSRQLVYNHSFTTSSKERYPFLAHRIAISINKHLEAPSIDWMDKFVIFSQYKDAKKSDIIIADYTLTFQKPIIIGGLNIFPKWADENQTSFYYTTYDKDMPTLVKINIYTRKREIIMKSQGMLVCSDVNESGTKLLITASPNYQPDIYLYDTKTKSKVKLTKYKGIDVGAHFVENDSKIVFVSDRLGYPNIFAKKLGLMGVEGLVFHGKNNSSASTYKDYIVYTSRDKNSEFLGQAFNLYLMSSKDDFLKRLTSNGSNQFPKFSRDGESIIFLKNINNKSFIGIIRLNQFKSFLFPLKNGKIQSIDW